MCWTQKFSFSRDPVILDLKLQLAPFDTKFKAAKIPHDQLVVIHRKLI
jgi:hypothetical protein